MVLQHRLVVVHQRQLTRCNNQPRRHHQLIPLLCPVSVYSDCNGIMLYSVYDMFYYLRQGGYVFVVACLSVCLLAALRKNVQTDLHKIFREGWQWADEQLTQF